MKKLGHKENFRVVIQPRALGDWGAFRTSDDFFYKDKEAIAEAYEERCAEMVKQVKRHVDDANHVHIEFDQASVCSHCGECWTEVSNTYNGGCCDEDEAENPEFTEQHTLTAGRE